MILICGIYFKLQFVVTLCIMSFKMISTELFVASVTRYRIINWWSHERWDDNVKRLICLIEMEIELSNVTFECQQWIFFPQKNVTKYFVELHDTVKNSKRISVYNQ